MNKIVFILICFLIYSCSKSPKDLLNTVDNSNPGDSSIWDPESYQFQNQFNSEQTFEILNVKKSANYPSSDNDTIQCLNWRLSNEDIRSIIKDSRLINGQEWHYLFEHYPCDISGQLKQKDNSYNFHINAGSWLTLTLQDTTIYLGYFDKKYRNLFIGEPLSEED